MPTALAQVDREKIYQWINELSSPETRENALLELSKKRESVPDLAPMLWHSFGTIAALLQVRRAGDIFIPWCISSTLQSLCVRGADVGRHWWGPSLPLLGVRCMLGLVVRGADAGSPFAVNHHEQGDVCRDCKISNWIAYIVGRGTGKFLGI